MCRLACIALLLTSSLGISPQPSVDPNVVLSRARQRLLADLARMPRYTCVETVTRHNYSPPSFPWHSSKSCAEFEADRLSVAINDVWVCRDGGVGDDRDLVDLTGREVRVTVDLAAGTDTATVWTNDLTPGYVHENSAYSS